MKPGKSPRIKIISMGQAEAGKSCIIKRYCERRFVSKYMATIGIDFGVTRVTIDGKNLKVNIFDMAGHPVFYEVRNEFYKGTQGCLLVFDVSDRDSFNALDGWIDEMKRNLEDSKDMEKTVFVVCGNKIDRARVVEEAEGQLWASKHGFYYFEVSAQTGEGIQELFVALFQGVCKVLECGKKPSPPPVSLAYNKEQADAIRQLRNGKTDYERLGLTTRASVEEINKAYRQLAVLIHPDKSEAPGTEEAFKLLVNARVSLLKSKDK